MLASSGTAVFAAAVEYSQFKDTYKPVPPPATAYPTLSPISDVPAVPASAGAVPSTATFPVTAGPHVPAVLSASEGTATFPVTAGPHVPAVLSASEGTVDAHVV